MAETARDPDVERLINEHLEAVDRALAAREVPLSERRSVTDDVEAQIRDMLAERAGGKPTTADVEAVLAGLDAPDSYAEDAGGAPAAVPVQPVEPARLCPLSVIGVVWTPIACILAAGIVLVLRLAAMSGGASPARTAGGLAWWILLLPAMTAPIGTTILGWVAVGRIRRSEGRLYGLGLAVFDGLLFPLLGLDAIIFASGTPVPAIVSLVVDCAIVYWVWRSLRVPAGD